MIATAALLVLMPAMPGTAQTFRRAGAEFNANRPVEVPPGKACSVVVTEFFHHGEITPDGHNVIVAARGGAPAPMRVLQLGPGDYCRLAFQPVGRQTAYEILYGGEGPTEPIPPLQTRDGLLLQTRHYKDCNLNRLDSVREAFNTAEPIGADYVENVSHAHNPFSLKDEPFLSRYSGTLHLDAPGTYGFLTSSRDASFLLIDDKLVVAAPGRHGPVGRALRGSRKDVRLSAGPHKFDYYHAAAGPSATMAAAWEVDPPSDKPLPTRIPTETFRADRIAHVPAGTVTLESGRQVPDFLVKIAGEVPLPDCPTPLIGVSFRDASPKALSLQGRLHWDFGDGQTGDRPNPNHVYLHPGLYTVRLSIERGSRSVEMKNRIYVDRPRLTRRDKLHTLDEYLKIVDTYDPGRLDAAALRQLVLAYEAKALQLEAVEEEKEEEPEGPTSADYYAKMVSVGKVALLGESAARDGEELLNLARLIAPVARDRLGDSDLAAKVWYGASQHVRLDEWKGECELQAADVAVNDLLNAKAAKTLLDSAAAHLGGKGGRDAARLQRVWGDYYALTGDGKAARQAYEKARSLRGAPRRFAERTAWRGAHSRSTEAFIRQRRLARAAAELRQWLDEFPTARIDGYLTLLYGRYWFARQQYAQAIAQAEQLQAVNPVSPYVDRLLLLAADGEVRRGRTDRALATLRSLLQDYPGSPLVPQAKEKIDSLEAPKQE